MVSISACHAEDPGPILGCEIWEVAHALPVLEMGLEPTISSLGGRHLIYQAARACVQLSCPRALPHVAWAHTPVPGVRQLAIAHTVDCLGAMILEAGLEAAISPLGGRRLIH